MLTLSVDNVLEYQQTIVLSGNILDLVILPAQGSVIYSIDNTCAPFQRLPSKDKTAVEGRDHIGFLKLFESTGRWQHGVHDETNLGAAIKAINAVADSDKEDELENETKRLGSDLFYNLESLRKKPGNEDAG